MRLGGARVHYMSEISHLYIVALKKVPAVANCPHPPLKASWIKGLIANLTLVGVPCCLCAVSVCVNSGFDVTWLWQYFRAWNSGQVAHTPHCPQVLSKSV